MNSTKTENYKKGKQGENAAKEYLVKSGYEFLEANFEIDIGEIDLIMVDKGWLVFVEVKYKSDNRLGIPEDMINRHKILQVKRVAEIYLMKNPELGKKYDKYRIDAVCILGEKVRHYKNIYNE